jgi:CPA2 family monovalent cation:H+ antiporter-2
MDILQVLVLVFALSIGVILLFHRIRMPAIIGFLLTGVLVGPHGLGLIGDSDVQLLAQIGVVLLLFTVGMEFSLKDIGRMKKPLFLGGFLQVFLTLGIAAFIAVQLGLTFQQGIFVGFLIALSSTAIILKLLQDRGEVYSPHGQIVIAISIFQDIVAVLMMLFIPTLAGAESSLPAALWVLAKGFGIIAAVIMAARWLVPRVLHTIAMTRTRELFLITVAVICFAVAWLTSSIGLSLALGAFLAGLILADSEYGDQALANMLPFRDVFMSLFFVSIGMLLDVNILRSNLSLILLLALGIIVLKSVVAAATAFLLGMPARIASLVGVAHERVRFHPLSGRAQCRLAHRAALRHALGGLHHHDGRRALAFRALAAHRGIGNSALEWQFTAEGAAQGPRHHRRHGHQWSACRPGGQKRGDSLYHS